MLNCFNFRSRQNLVTLGLLVSSLAAWPCHADVTLTVTPASSAPTAGEEISLWVNALNPTDAAEAWTFPQQIERKLISAQGNFTGSLQLRSTETNAVTISPGTFVRREYISTLPATISGQMVMEFSGVEINRTVLDVQNSGWNGTTKTNGSAFNRFIVEAEPMEPGHSFDPGRFFKEHISGYEPMYFIGGTKSPNVKFQISLAYQILNTEGPLAEKAPLLKGFHLAYTQSSLWDWNGDSAPFYDTSYKPELFYAWKNITHAAHTNWFKLDLAGGLKHESNGKDGLDSRSLSLGYLQPTFTFGRDGNFQLTLQPRVWGYLGDLSDNADITDYRGYADLRTVVGWQRGLQLSVLGRMGKDGNHGSAQFDLTYPTMRFFGSFSLYLDLQYFNGYGESLLGYNEKTEVLRVGLALFR